MKKNTASYQEISEDSEINTALINYLLKNANDGVFIYDEHRNILYVNDMASELSGYTKSELLKMNVSDLDRTKVKATPAEFMIRAKQNKRMVFETEHVSKSGKLLPVEVSIATTCVDGVIYNSAFVRDISERLEFIRSAEERFQVIADMSPVALIISRISDGSIQYTNKQLQVLFGKTAGELEQISILELFDGSDASPELLENLRLGKGVKNEEVFLERSNFLSTWFSLNAQAIMLEGEHVLCCALLDITEAHDLSNQLSYQATYDDLTGLVNRREFEDRLHEVIKYTEKSKTENALCYLDLDQFKIINDTCGHLAGDELLRQLARVLFRCTRRDDTLARIGGDEFAILLENCPLKNAEQIADNIRKKIECFRFQWQENTFNISVSIGLTPIDKTGDSLIDALRRADSACYGAKDAGRNRVHVFSFDDKALAQRHGEMKWVAGINVAIDENRLELWRQEIAQVNKPGAENNESAASHFEVLLRMRDENGKLVSPDAFLPAAERFDLAPKIDRWVMKEIFNWFSKNSSVLDGLGVCAINLSGQTLSDASFLEEIIAHFKTSELSPEKVCFEITETAAIANLSHATKFMRTLKGLGCTFALDDFGSGLSSFAYLKNLPVDYVKIDGLFVKDMVSNPVDFAMVKAINDMAHAMGKLTIAEFVEDDLVLHDLIELGVDYVQGYGISKPAPLV